MITNPYRGRLANYPGTHLLEETFGLVGASFWDPIDARKYWVISSFYTPVERRALGGVRAKLTDQKGFVTFCNQRDLEVLLGMGQPGTYCMWSGTKYCGPEDDDWCGLCCDDEDLLDDLFERECFLRAQVAEGVLYPPLDIVRRVHTETHVDREEVFVFVSDVDPHTGYYPDRRLETTEQRWARSERRLVQWERS